MVATELPNLLGFNRQRCEELFADLGEKPFRAGQVMKWIHQRGVLDIDAMTDLSRDLRKRLREAVQLRPPEVVADHVSADGSRKWIVRSGTGSKVEMVYIPEAGRGTLCVSSQRGCALDCTFCATGKQGFDGNLDASAIIGQLWWANRILGAFDGSGTRPVSNVVMMGMGEPLLNFDNVMEALDIMLDDFGYGLSKRRVTISTAGVAPAIDRMRQRTEVCLAVSLHAPNDELRSRIMPINRRYPIAELLRAVRGYIASLPDKRVPLVEYVLIAGINDHRQHARELAELLRDFPCKINLIPFNPFSLSDYRRPAAASLTNFSRILREAGYTVMTRTTRAEDISAACGQLVGEVVDKTRRSRRHQQAAAAGQDNIITSSGARRPAATEP